MSVKNSGHEAFFRKRHAATSASALHVAACCSFVRAKKSIRKLLDVSRFQLAYDMSGKIVLIFCYRPTNPTYRIQMVSR